MKVFNWVHRVFNHKDGLAENAKKNGVVADKSSGDYKLEKNAFSDHVAFDGWKGGILAIGTFGYDPLKNEEGEQNDDSFYTEESFSEKEQQLSVLENLESDDQITDFEEEEEEEEEEEDEEVNPLVYAAYGHDYEGLLEMKMGGNRRVSLKDEFEFAFDAIAVSNAIKKERTTLAELFYADSEELQGKKLPTNKGEINVKEKSNYTKHGRLSFAKKLIGDQDARPIHKLHRLMRRMLKRKIHPDVGLDSAAVVEKWETISESASLLPTQDAII